MSCSPSSRNLANSGSLILILEACSGACRPRRLQNDHTLPLAEALTLRCESVPYELCTAACRIAVTQHIFEWCPKNDCRACFWHNTRVMLLEGCIRSSPNSSTCFNSSCRVCLCSFLDILPAELRWKFQSKVLHLIPCHQIFVHPALKIVLGDKSAFFVIDACLYPSTTWRGSRLFQTSQIGGYEVLALGIVVKREGSSFWPGFN